VRRTRAQIDQLLEAFARSGLTQQAFCQQNGLSAATFSNWRRKAVAADGIAADGIAAAEAGAAGAAGAAPETVLRAVRVVSQSPSEFPTHSSSQSPSESPAQTYSHLPARSQSPLQSHLTLPGPVVRLPDGFEIVLPAESTAAEIAKLIGALRAIGSC